MPKLPGVYVPVYLVTVNNIAYFLFLTFFEKELCANFRLKLSLVYRGRKLPKFVRGKE